MSRKKFRNPLDICCVYALLDPRNGLAHYVGSTLSLHARLCSHNNIDSWRTHTLEYCKWRVELAKIDLVPDVAVVEVCKFEELRGREKYWITHGLQIGWPLTNKPVEYTKPTNTTKEKIKLIKQFKSMFSEYRGWTFDKQ